MKKGLCLIVGGNRGIGKGIFDLFSKKNINTYVLDIENRKSNKFIQVDLSNKKSLDNVLRNKIFKKKKIKNLIFCQRFRGDNIHSHFEVSFFPVANLIEKLKRKMEKNHSRSTRIWRSKKSVYRNTYFRYKLKNGRRARIS